MAKRADRALAQIFDRIRAIERELRLLAIEATSDYFEPPATTIDSSSSRISVRTTRDHRFRIRLAEGITAGFSDIVRLEIAEDYSFEDIHHGRGDKIILIKYSYAIACRFEWTIDPSDVPGDPRDHWDPILLAQHKFFRFDGSPNSTGRDRDTLEHRNQHPVHHFHPSTKRYLRFPVPCQPGILAVASFALIDLDHARWLDAAQHHPEVLRETQQLLPHITLD